MLAVGLYRSMTPPTPPLRLAIFGDSIAYGQGAADPSHTIGERLDSP